MSIPPRPPSLAALLSTAHDVAAALPEGERVEVIWRGPEGVRVHLELAGSLPAAPTSVPTPLVKLSKTYRKVIKALGRECLDGPEIADRAGYGYGGWFCEQLSDMRLAGVLLGDRGEAGYRVAPAYLQEAAEGETAKPEGNRR